MYCINSYSLFVFLFAVNSVGCVYYNGVLSLRCNSAQLIHIVNATVGWSSRQCQDEKRCCPSLNDNTGQEPIQYVQYLKNRCDRLWKCDVRVRSFTIGGGRRSDYESVNYICSNSPAGKVTFYCLI